MDSSVTSELSVSGMTCNNCVRHVTEALQAVPGVHSASVNLQTGRAAVRWSGPEQADALLTALQEAGYPARRLDPDAPSDHAAHSNWHTNLWLGGIITATLMLGEWVFDLGMTRWFQWLSFGLAGAVQAIAGAEFYRGAWRQLRVGRSNMDTLVALGSTTAFGYSTWALLMGIGGHTYFMEAAAIITLISIGHWIEARVSARASHTLTALLQLAPRTARRLQSAPVPAAPARFSPSDLRRFKPQATPEIVETEVPVSTLLIGDRVVLRPGDHVPVDGRVVGGESAVDESMLTGESRPVDKAKGAELYAGTINRNGRLEMEVTATGEATALAHVIAAVQRAQTSRASIQRLGDQVSAVFVPVVVVIALVAALWWGLAPATAAAAHDWLAPWLWTAHPPTGSAAAFVIAAAVLIIACPCAMGLATPAAIMASANAAARRGILIRDGAALEKAGKIDAVVLDKTGTLTRGELAIAGLWTSLPENEFRQSVEAQAGALAEASHHPVSKVLARLAHGKIEFTGWQEIPGAGLQALSGSETLRLGSVAWLRADGVAIPDNDQFAQWHETGANLVGLARGHHLAGVFALTDSLKPNSREVVRQLQAQGLRTYLLTGDNAQTAAGVARQVGIPPDQVLAEVRPEQKAEFVKRLQARGERVAFVGDGINDAPALEQSDLGIAVGKASDVAREAADLVLLRSDIEAIPEALGLARATLRTIKQNLFWAFFYNAIGVPLAALGFMSPVLCAAAMGLSDLIVIGNALRLRRWRLRPGP